MISPPLFVLVVALGQVSVPLDSQSYHTSSCSSGHNTGFVPFTAALTCRTHAGHTGCAAQGQVDLATQALIQGNLVYPYLCERPVAAGTVPIQAAEIELSGVKFNAVPAGAQQRFKQLKIELKPVGLNGFVFDWKATANWLTAPNAMVDWFTVDIFGELVWTTGQDSALIRTSAVCATPDESCLDKTQVTWPAGWVYGGTAFSGITIESQSSSWNGVTPTELSTDLFEAVRSQRATIAYECALKDGSPVPPGVSCDFELLSIVGQPSEVSRAGGVGPFSAASNPPVTQGFSVPFLPRAATRCGLRQFKAESNHFPAEPTSAVWFGADSRDCGWSPGDVYSGKGLHGYEASQLPFSVDTVDFSLDATQLP